ncbi:MAG: cobalamin biosynthesis protein CobW [Alphaproteobacteria bacterium]|jgi:cobalamin biosynthesis protein CobW
MDEISGRVRSKIPATVITGFLGAGKTSLIRHVLETANGRRLALIINEFGDVGMDRDILAACGIEGCTEDDIVELANGCICCTVADDFLPVMEALLARPEPPEHIVIETSGLALPKPLIQAFNWPDIRTRVTVDGVITVIDAEAVAAGLFASDPEAVAAQRAADPMLDHDSPLEEVFEDQLYCADMVVLNKTDLLDEASLARVRSDIAAKLKPGVKLAPTSHARIDAAILLGLDAAAEDDLDTRPSHHDGLDGEHDHDDFESFTVTIEAVADPLALYSRIEAAIAAHGILRIKGVVEVANKDMRHVIQAVGARVQGYYDRAWRDGEPRLSRLVVIGEIGLDAAAIAQSLKA